MPGPERDRGHAAQLARLGLHTARDVVLHLPLRYEDLTRRTPIGEARGGPALVEGEVARVEVVSRGRRSLLVDIDDGSGTLTLRFFHFHGAQQARLQPGTRVRAWGEVRAGLVGAEMVHPTWRLLREPTPLPDRLTPVYPTVAGVSQWVIREAVVKALRAPQWPETLPADVLAERGWPSLEEALRWLHAPPPGADAAGLENRSAPAWQRLIVDELVAQQLSLRRARAERARLRATALAERGRASALLAALPFALTDAQRRAFEEIAADLDATQPMHRLLQGDVGSGKTVVAALAAAIAVGSGRQAALMAPTEILAEQHRDKLTPLLERIGVRVAWLAGSMRDAAKRAVRAAVAAGEVDVLIGTHALIEEGTVFRDLGLVIVDEQHRFGVAQRLALRSRHETNGRLPHQLMMSATPIPRTLAMTYYADLDVSVIDALPPGRSPIATRLAAASRREEIVARVRDAVAAGGQAYWVCPLIEESETLDLQTALDTYAELTRALAPLRVELVHGRMPAADKQAAMQAFARGEAGVLVATTVIEVGVDVPNASLMVVEHAERFGLAQLHQLRGRVGRGRAASTCVLLYQPPLSATARERLRAMYDTQDGFEIARRDLALRGPGELLGARQSGVPMLRFADLERDAAWVPVAAALAQRLEREAPQAAERHLQWWLGGREAFLRA